MQCLDTKSIAEVLYALSNECYKGLWIKRISNIILSEIVEKHDKCGENMQSQCNAGVSKKWIQKKQMDGNHMCAQIQVRQ